MLMLIFLDKFQILNYYFFFQTNFLTMINQFKVVRKGQMTEGNFECLQ